MKARIMWIALGMICSAYIVGFANDAKSPKQLGAGWAKISDRAQIEMLLDAMGAAPAAALSTNKSLNSSDIGHANLQPSREILVSGETAIVHLQTGETLQFVKTSQNWSLSQNSSTMIESLYRKAAPENSGDLLTNTRQGFSAGETFQVAPVSLEHGMDRISRNVTESALDRALFGAPEKSASYYQAEYTRSTPYVSANYIQFVTDPAWNRIIYGSLNKWIKSYENINGPSAIAVDADGRVFIAETGEERILVLQLEIAGDAANLEYRFEIAGAGTPTDLALDDNGTPLNTNDDRLYVTDAATNAVLVFELDENAARKVAAHSGFDSPMNILAGKWNGANTNLIYVIDKVGKRLQLIDNTANSFQLIRELAGSPGQYFHAVKADHFGNIYLVDNMNSSLMKFTAQLEFLDALSGENAFDGLANIDIGFGKISIEGEGTFWAGFDQLFSLERWTGASGIQRRALGVGIRNAQFSADIDAANITSDFTLTDFADVTVNVYDMQNRLVREHHHGMMVSGRKTIFWDRRDNAGKQIAAGEYRMEITAGSPYEQAPVTLAAQLHLPAYYWQNSGSSTKTEDGFLVNGTPVQWGVSPTETAVEDPEQIMYRFQGLNPASQYQVAFEFYAGDGESREQAIVLNGRQEIDNVSVTGNATKTAFIELPAESFSDGSISIHIARRSGVSAVVSQIWFKETGASFTVQEAAEAGSLPANYVLEDNFPNPFNPSTNIRFQLPLESRVALEIFNVLGQKVRVLLSDNFSAGAHTIQWDGKNDIGNMVSSGIYIYRITAGEFTASKRMLLIK